MARPVRLIAVPYDSGRRGARMGRGPAALLRGLRGDRVQWIEATSAFPCEVATTFELARSVASAVSAAVAAGELPVVLAGNCFTAVGTLAGVGAGAAVAWFDCHGDFHTPESTASGFLDGMGLATAVGRCWGRLAAAIPGAGPLDPRRVIHLGGRDFDPGEREALEAAGVTVRDAATLNRLGPEAALGPPLARWPAEVVRSYVHIDLDALDPSEAPANALQTPGGLSVETVLASVRLVGARAPVRAAALTAYDPDCDPEGRVIEVARRLVRCLEATAA